MDDIHIIARGADWLKQFVPVKELEGRRKRLIEHLGSALRPSPGNITRITYEKDMFIWYLLLAEMYISRSVGYDFFQGSRAIPYFKAIGLQVGLLEQIKGIEDRTKRVVQEGGDNPDTGIFELLTAACYQRNGYTDVEFIPEGQRKTPDIFAHKDHDVFIECKRLTRLSQYSLDEREKWFLLWEPVGKHIAQNRISLFFKILFKKELFELPDSFLEDELIPKLQFLPTTYFSNPIDNEYISVECFPIDYSRIREYLGSYYLRTNSPQYINILLGEYEQFGNYRLVVEAHPTLESPILISDVSFAAGASWKSTSEKAIDMKSRHIKKRLADAFKQMPSNDYGIIHLGVEAIEGDEIEQLRLLKNHIQVRGFDFKNKPLQWIYLHILSPGVNPNEDWIFEETVTKYGHTDAIVPVLEKPNLMPFDETYEGFAWDLFR
nr:hypothetical protein [uncultured Pseudodesulfovibrio sp.]